MERRKNDFLEIEVLKERYENRIREQELKMKSHFSEFSDHLTGVALFNKLKDNLFSGSGLAFKLGFMAVTMLRKRLDERKRNRK